MARAHCGIESILLDFLAKRGLVRALRIAVAYSGGPDSTALLAALSALSPCRPIALYVDHGLRESRELEEEMALVRRTCAALGAGLIVAHVRPGAVLERAKSENEGVEAAARRFRYAAFRSAMTKSGAQAVLLAHTMDDQIETVLMRLLGGSGAGGLIGIPEASGPFLRPFLGIRKAVSFATWRRKASPTPRIRPTRRGIPQESNTPRPRAVLGLEPSPDGERAWRRLPSKRRWTKRHCRPPPRLWPS